MADAFPDEVNENKSLACTMNSSVTNNTLEIHTTEMHTGGEPLRIITKGFPCIQGHSILEKRRFVRNHYDNLRKFLMFEPRGHFDMYGALLVEPDHAAADIGVIFLHNEGYSTMCGHAVIGLGRYIVDANVSYNRKGNILERAKNNVVKVGIQCPCGLVYANVQLDSNKTKSVSFQSVPAFAMATDVMVKTKEFGDVMVDIGYGGAFYALVSDKALKLSLSNTSYRDLVNAASIVSAAVKSQITIQHPEEETLSFLYGTIITDGQDTYDAENVTANLCVFADSQVDRSPTGSGVTARIAVQYAKGLIQLDQCRTFENSFVKSRFTGKAVKKTTCGSYDAVIVEVAGRAFYTGKSVFTMEEDDPLRHGFIIKTQ